MIDVIAGIFVVAAAMLVLIAIYLIATYAIPALINGCVSVCEWFALTIWVLRNPAVRTDRRKYRHDDDEFFDERYYGKDD